MNNTLPTIKCILCGVDILSNPTAKCSKCLSIDFDVTEGVSKNETIYQCPNCSRYKPHGNHTNRWLVCEPESADLLALCLKKIKGIGTGTKHANLVDAKFIWQEAHNRRLKVRMTLQKEEVASKVKIQQQCDCDFVVSSFMCPDCQAETVNQNAWRAVVQVRQNTTHKRSLFYMEQELVKKNSAEKAINIEEEIHGLNVFFAKLDHAQKFADAVQSVVPAGNRKESKQLQKYDQQNNDGIFRYTIFLEVAPICKHDLCVLPSALQSSLFGTSRPMLVLCTSISHTIRLVNLKTFQEVKLPAQKFFSSPFKPLASPKEAIEYMVLDVIPTRKKTNNNNSNDNEKKKKMEDERVFLTHGEVEIARLKDVGENDERFTVFSNIAHLLREGDIVLGYDVRNMRNHLEEIDDEVDVDVVLIAKKKEEKKKKNSKKKVKALGGGAARYWSATENDILENEEEEEQEQNLGGVVVDSNIHEDLIEE